MLASCLVSGAARPATHTQKPDLQLDSLDDGPGSRMTTVLRKRFLLFRVDVVRVSMRFGRETSSELRRLTEGGRLPWELGGSIASTAIASRDALVEVEFLRNITLEQFLSTARDSIRLVWRNGVIRRETYEQIRRSLPGWYRSLEERGIHRGDRMFYRIRGDRLHTVFLGSETTRHVDQVDTGRESVRAVLGSYLVEGSEFREGLLRSLR
jgi:hypothetical protein